jgi:HAD superfamily hydrolase (TIGR01459 family)
MGLPPPAGACRIIAGLHELKSRYDVILCDVWGVLHDGRRSFPEPAQALLRFRAEGGTVVLLTNAPRPCGAVMRQLDGLGVPRAAYDGLVTSGDATVALIAARGNKPLLHIGPPRDHALLDEVRLKAGFQPRCAKIEEADYGLCTGLFDDAVETPDDYAALLMAMKARDLDMICANPDIVVHVGERMIYCAGALAQRYAGLGGRVLLAGKPHAPIYEVALKAAAAARAGGFDRGRVLAVGDGLGTDIAGAAGQGFDSLFVTSGIHRAETLDRDGRLDAAALTAFLQSAPHQPRAAIASLCW